MSYEFEPYSELLHYGNRQDIELGDDKWISWHAEQHDRNYVPDEWEAGAMIDIYGDDAPLQQYEVIWRRVT